MRRLIIGGLLAFLVSSPSFAGKRDLVDADGVNLMKLDTVYTLSNLHPDDVHARLYAVNYQQSGLIPVCTAVKLDKKNKKVLKFTVKDSGRQYQYIYHKAAAEKLAPHLLNYFGKSCPKAALKALKGVDKKGVEMGKALTGMSKAAVLLALGKPPKHVNPTPKTMQRWTYWSNRFNRFVVVFDDRDRVAQLIN